MQALSLGPRKNLALLEITSGMALLTASEFLLFKGVEPFASNFYLFVWWAYILAVDAIIYFRKGNSLILSRTGEFLVMLPWSAAFWLLFELVNLRLENWYYVNVTPVFWIRWPGYFFAYATVLPGIFETAELLGCLGLYKKKRVKPRVPPSASFPAFYAIGLAFLVLPLVFPRVCFPLIWLAFIFLLDPINYVHGAPSLLRDWADGRPRTFLLLLTAGLVCGGLWEFWNYWAHTKWIYTVPFFDELKLFEMPLAGFLGFPPFAVECYVMYNFISVFRFRRTWTQGAFLKASSQPLSLNITVCTSVVMLVFYVSGFCALDRYTVSSYIVPFEDISFLSPQAVSAFDDMGIKTIPEFLQACSTESACEANLKQAGLSEEEFDYLVERFRLAALKWMGVDNAVLLNRTGVDTTKELAGQDPDKLYRAIQSQADKDAKTPTRAMTQLWIRAAEKATTR